MSLRHLVHTYSYVYGDMREYVCVCGAVVNYGLDSFFALHSALHLTTACCSGCFYRSNPDDREKQWRQKRKAEDEKGFRKKFKWEEAHLKATQTQYVSLKKKEY